MPRLRLNVVAASYHLDARSASRRMRHHTATISARADLMAPNIESAEAMAEDLNSKIGLDNAERHPSRFRRSVRWGRRMAPQSI